MGRGGELQPNKVFAAAAWIFSFSPLKSARTHKRGGAERKRKRKRRILLPPVQGVQRGRGGGGRREAQVGRGALPGRAPGAALSRGASGRLERRARAALIVPPRAPPLSPPSAPPSHSPYKPPPARIGRVDLCSVLAGVVAAVAVAVAGSLLAFSAVHPFSCAPPDFETYFGRSVGSFFCFLAPLLRVAMTIKTQASGNTLTYSKMRGMVTILIAFMKQRRMGLNDFIQKIATNSYACKHPEVQSILKISQPQEPELMNANPSPPPSPSQQINLGPSSNPHAKPSDFHFLKVIGKGSFGKVLLARHKAEEQFYAVKVLQKKAILKKKEEKHIMSERNVLLKNVKHPFLVGLHFSFQTADKLYFVLDYINGGELFYHLQRERCFLEPRARFYAAEIASALGYLHSLNIVYRDLKPENILLDSQGHIVLTDFGLCKENIEPNGTTSTFCGTPEYLAPEVLHKQPYDRTVDWWCLGAVLYEMLYGLPPFYSRNTAEMYDNILNKPLQLKPNITNSARHLLEGLLQKDRTKRLGAKEDFMEIKNHIFFSPINWDDLINKKITPPFNPNVSGPNDLRHFDPEFTEEPVPNSIGQTSDSILITASVKEAAEAFLGFSYAPSMDSFL